MPLIGSDRGTATASSPAPTSGARWGSGGSGGPSGGGSGGGHHLGTCGSGFRESGYLFFTTGGARTGHTNHRSWTGSQGLALVSTIINLAHSLKLKVVAEGVETEEQSRLLRLLNCDEAQGFLLGKPLAAGTFESSFLAP